MALVRCPDCSRDVSDQAPNCPNCGRPLIPPTCPPAIPHTKKVVDLPKQGFICESCGEVGWPKTFTKGSIIIELFLWLLLIVPGIIYSIWRLTSRYKACPACHGRMVPINTPGGRLLAQKFNPHVQVR
jgi:hypothetical protein